VWSCSPREPADRRWQLVSIGSLLAFLLVCVGVVVLRRTSPAAARPFRVPGVPWVPALGGLVCLAQMVSLPWATWERLLVWLALGLVLYFAYGRSRAKAKRGVMAPAVAP
jgi:APA family basic amino acid/polyamine antiporter